VCVIKSKHFGVVFLVAIAATLVGSMEIIGKENEECSTGEYHGKFYFGGSTVILLFQPNTIKLEDDLVYNTMDRKKETLVKVRSVLGKSIKTNKKPLNTRVNLKKSERINNCGCG
jgi:phosphatidylserine decarboxylase